MKILAVCALSLFALCIFGAELVRVEFYHQPGCGDCGKVKALVLPRLADELAGEYELLSYDIGETDNFIRLLGQLERLHTDDNETVYVIVNNAVVLAGYKEIETRLIAEVSGTTSATSSSADSEFGSGVAERRAASFTRGAIIAAGLADGVNPCVFSTLIFFISMLAVFKVRGRRMIIAGLVYCLACFLCYFALGVGLFQVLRAFSHFAVARMVLEYVMITVLLICAAATLIDLINYRRSRDSGKVLLQIPARIKERIHAVMRRGLQYRYLIPGTFAIGVLVCLLETVCTGQVYVPTLALMVREYGGGRWLWYLLLYNLMFILPLAAVFVITYRGVSSAKLIKWSADNLVWGKLILFVLFTGLAGLMIFLRG